MGNKEVEKGEGQKENKADMDAETPEVKVAEEATVVEITQEFVAKRRLRMRLLGCNWGRRKRVFVKRIRQSWGLYQRI